MESFDAALAPQLDAIRGAGLYRNLRHIESACGAYVQFGARTLLNFASNDYLGLASHPALKEAAIKAVEQFGAGSGASRLMSGSIAPHRELEEALAAFKGTEAALSFSSGYAAAIGAICALLGNSDVIVLDKLMHACVIDAAKLSGAEIRVFKHNDLNDLEAILKWADARRTEAATGKSRILIVTESVFSMDGDCAPLREIVELKERYGAWLMVDEAHATGVFGPTGAGLVEELGLRGRVEIQLVTLGKALGAAGGAICGSRSLIDLLINRARSFIYSTAPVPAAAAAAAAAVQLVQSETGAKLREMLHQNIRFFRTHLGGAYVELKSPIVPYRTGAETAASALSAKLLERGFFVPAVRYPTVPRGKARLRISLTAAHAPDHLEGLARALKQVSAEHPAGVAPQS